MIFVIDPGIKFGSSGAIGLIYIVESNLKNLVDEILSNPMHQNMEVLFFLCRMLHDPYDMLPIILRNGKFFVIKK